jgi:hypothetical protein
MLTIDDAASISEVADLGLDPPALLEHVPLPANAAALGAPYTAVLLGDVPVGIVRVSATWGWPAVPDDVHQAAIQQAAAWYTHDSSRVGDVYADELGAQARAGGVAPAVCCTGCATRSAPTAASRSPEPRSRGR